MWNVSLGALAQKAKEAAARLESHLDDSIGIADDSLFGNKSSAASDSALGALGTTREGIHDDFNDEDDFFSDTHHEDLLAQRPQPQVDNGHLGDNMSKQLSSPLAKKLDVSADDGDNFFGEEDKEESYPDAQPTEVSETNNEEEVDFGMGDAGEGDGWGEGEDIRLDDEEDLVMIEQEQKQVVERDLEGKTVEAGLNEAHEASTEFDHVTELLGTPCLSSSTSQEIIKNSASEDGSPFVNMPPNNVDVVEDLYEDEVETSMVEAESFRKEAASRTDEVEPEVVGQEERFVEMETLQTGQEPLETSTEEEPHGEVVENESGETSTSLIQNEFPAMSTMVKAPGTKETEKLQFLETISQLESQLLHREEQLASKSEQITSLTMQHESEITKLRQVISETKEEARKRILKAKERVEEMQSKLSEAVRRAESAGGDSHEQSEIIAALRAEGEQLARKQSQMEQSVRSAKSEARDLAEQVQIQKEGRESALKKIEVLEKEIKSLKDELASARKGESQSKKLENDLFAAKEESEKQRASNLGLEQELRELREENKTLRKAVEDAKAGAALESEKEANKLRKERDDMLSDLESKLRTCERESNLREDALRHEVSELRKRWQDAVRRAEDLSMDVQHSTAPLLRQLESTERQNRARASAWAELETKLRSDLEEHVIQLEKMNKERNDIRASEKRLQRTLKEKEDEIASLQNTIEDLSSTAEALEVKAKELEEDMRRAMEEKAKFERQSSEGVAKVRSELMKSMVESEETYRSRIETLEAEIADERQRRDNLIKQLDTLAENVKTVEFSHTRGMSTGALRSFEKEKRLVATTNQASILHDTLLGMDSDNDDGEEEDDISNLQGGSFAAMEQLSQGLKGAKLELEALRNQLASSEESRESLLAELAETRQAAEKLPLFESKVSELTMEVKLKDMEIKGLQDDIADVRFLYRQQLDALLEEKASDSHLGTSLQEEEKLALNTD
ncbi:hypothetical protein ACHAWX_001624 [Stephanocyclus meneghinianus]